VRTSPRVAAALCVGALVLGACSSDGATPDDGASTTTAAPSPSSPTSPTAADTDAPSPSASPSDPCAMPDPVTEEYVDRVVNTIYEEWGAISRELLEEPADPTAITPVETRERIAELFAGEYLQRRLEEADDKLRGDREGLLPPEDFGQLRFTTEVLTESSTACLVAVGRIDFSETATGGGQRLVAMSLTPADSDETNETGWLVMDQLVNTDPEGNELPESTMLQATVDDFGESLENSC
jgi:hypothetical protein